MHLFPLFPVGLKVRYIHSMPFICLSYRRKHNLSTCHRLYTVQSKTTLFKLFLAAFFQLRNPELCGLSDACTGSLTTRTGSPTGNEINKNSIPRQKVQQRLGYFSGEMVSTEWYVQVKTLMDTVCFLSLYLAVVEMHALPFSLLFYRETRKCNGYSAHLALLNFACTSLHCCRVQG